MSLRGFAFLSAASLRERSCGPWQKRQTRQTNGYRLGSVVREKTMWLKPAKWNTALFEGPWPCKSEVYLRTLEIEVEIEIDKSDKRQSDKGDKTKKKKIWHFVISKLMGSKSIFVQWYPMTGKGKSTSVEQRKEWNKWLPTLPSKFDETKALFERHRFQLDSLVWARSTAEKFVGSLDDEILCRRLGNENKPSSLV